MNRQKTTIERFAINVESIKRGIVKNIKQTKKLLKETKKANGDTDKKALLNEINRRRDMAEKYRVMLNDLAVAYVRENRFSKGAERICNRFKYRTVDAFLADKDALGNPSLAQMVQLVANYGNINLVYKFEYDEFGRREIKRDFSTIKAPEISHMIFDTQRERRTVEDAVNSGTRHG